jgi:hypothetical protein
MPVSKVLRQNGLASCIAIRRYAQRAGVTAWHMSITGAMTPAQRQLALQPVDQL